MNHSPVAMIFEIGLNHMGDELRALRMIDELKAQGASHISLQIVTDVAAFTRNADTVAHLQKYCLSLEQNLRAIRYAVEIGLIVGATVTDPQSVEPLQAAGVAFFKILSGDLTYIQLIVRACATGLPVYLSTGAATVDEMARTINFVRASVSAVDLRLIHTVLVVPTPPELLNLNNISALSREFGLPVSYGQHSDIMEALDYAVAAGADSLFVYVAESKLPELPDGPHAIECVQAGEFLRKIRKVEQILGTEERIISEREYGARIVARRSIVALRRLETGQIVTEEDITFKRPRSGLNPADLTYILGKAAPHNFEVAQDVIVDEAGESD